MIKVNLDGYELLEKGFVQYEPYIPYRVLKADNSTDYQASAEKHLEEIANQEEAMKDFKTPEQRIEQLEKQLIAQQEQFQIELAESNTQMFELIMMMQGGIE